MPIFIYSFSQKYFKSILKKKFEAEQDNKMRTDGLVFIKYVFVILLCVFLDKHFSYAICQRHAEAVESIHRITYVAIFSSR